MQSASSDSARATKQEANKRDKGLSSWIYVYFYTASPSHIKDQIPEAEEDETFC